MMPKGARMKRLAAALAAVIGVFCAQPSGAQTPLERGRYLVEGIAPAAIATPRTGRTASWRG
jgi:hypothetical protein